MNVNAPFNFKIIAAKILLSFLIFIHVEKAIHNHANSSTTSFENGYANSSRVNACSICEYVFAKDAGLPEAVLLSIPINDFFDWNKTVLAIYFDDSNKSITGRGPPIS